MVIITEAQNKTELDPELRKLENIPMFLPVMKTTLNLPILTDTEPDDKLDICPVLKLCTRSAMNDKLYTLSVIYYTVLDCTILYSAFDFTDIKNIFINVPRLWLLIRTLCVFE